MSYQYNIVGTTLEDKLFGNLNNVSIANAFRNIGKHFDGVAIGAISEVVTINSGPSKGVGTITIATGNMTAADYVIINSVTLTARASPSGTAEFKVGSTAVKTAYDLCACINANPSLSPIVVASVVKSSTSGVVTVTAINNGTVGNYVWSQSGSNVTLKPSAAMGGGANGPISATSTWTIATTGPTNGETCAVAGITFTAKTSGAVGNQFNISSTASIVAANFAAAINGSPDMQGVVTASANAGVVTLTAAVPGKIGNSIPTDVGTLANTTVVAFAGVGAVTGTNANYVTLHKGI